ncbi:MULTISPECIES: hypothetical protein [unclassified Cupriavidus]|uniref:hypothetical protein n=1 Tax=unclassified Cupriavidus TaxID=2640874 RepID=UPI00313D35EE
MPDEYDTLLANVKKYWSNTARAASATKRDLRTLIEEIEILIDTLPDDCNAG